MKRLVTLFAIVLLSNNPAAAASANESFEILTVQYVSDVSKFSPVSATLIGDHSADHELDQIDAQARTRIRALYVKYRDELAAIDREQLSRPNQVDTELLHNEIESRLWSSVTLQEWAWNPIFYVDLSGSSVYGLVARDFTPIEERFATVASRLEQIPRFLRQARASIQPERVPKVHV